MGRGLSGQACRDVRLLIWDERERKLFAARDRFGVKPLYYHIGPDGDLLAASEIKALHAAGIPAEPDDASWAAYLTHGLKDHSERTFWKGVRQLPAGHCLTWRNGVTGIARWYDLAERSGAEYDQRPVEQVQEEYLSLLADSVRLRFRSDVPVGVNLSGGLIRQHCSRLSKPFRAKRAKRARSPSPAAIPDTTRFLGAADARAHAASAHGRPNYA